MGVEVPSTTGFLECRRIDTLRIIYSKIRLEQKRGNTVPSTTLESESGIQK